MEMAITLPLLILLLFGFYELARANLARNLAQDAAYEAARELIVAGAQPAEGVQVANQLLQVIGVCAPQSTISPATITPQTPEVAVTVTVPIQALTGFGDLFLSGASVQGQCTLQREGFRVTPPTSPPPAGD